MPADEFVYTDAQFALKRQRHYRLTVQASLVIMVVNGLGWGAFGYSFSAYTMAVVNFVFVFLALVGLVASGFLPLRAATHITIATGTSYVWSFILLVEGVPGLKMPLANHWWFLGIATGALLLFFNSTRWRAFYTAACLFSFVICELGLVLVVPGQSFPDFSPESFKLISAAVHVSVFVSVLLLLGVFVSSIATAEKQLGIANETLESLLSNLLPRSIAERLRREGKTFADGYSECSVLFVDLVGFTQLTGQMSPDKLVHLLDEIFSRFDDLTEKSGLEKIKTIGDAYMVAAGLPVPRDDHAQACVALATAIRAVVREYAGLKVRIGINSGSVIAGIIGKRKFIYDLWGDTVNVASRMESQGVVDEIQVTERTAALIAREYETIPRGKIEVKGKGSMLVYLVSGRRLSPTEIVAVELPSKTGP